MDEETKQKIKDICAKLRDDIPTMKPWRVLYLEDVNFLISELTVLELKLVDADILAMTTDVAVKRGSLNARSLIADARLDYGNPWKYEHATEKHLLSYRRGIPEVIEALKKG